MENLQKINYQLLCEETIKEISTWNPKAKLLLHTCCGPCSSYVLEYLSQYFDISVLYYNPNIDTEEEHSLRTEEQAILLEKMNLAIPMVAIEYAPERYYEAVKGYEHHKEGGARCDICYKLRLEEAVKYAKEHGFDYFTTSLSISPMKNAVKLNHIGENLAKEYGIKYLFSDFKKKNGYKRSIELSKKFNMYRQEYCGCVFSRIEREEQIKKQGENKGNSSFLS